MQPYPHPEAAELVKLLPAKKQARFYRLEIWPDLFGGFSLAREMDASASPDACNSILSPRSTQPAKPLPASSAGSSAGGISRARADSPIDGKPLQLSLPEVWQPGRDRD
jgi:hypothetical protein